jgi:hypothetical protein
VKGPRQAQNRHLRAVPTERPALGLEQARREHARCDNRPDYRAEWS